MPKHHDSVSDFVHHRVRELIEKDAFESHSQEFKPITVRLPEGYVALIDKLASELDFTRQAFLLNLVSEALDDAIRGLVMTMDEPDAIEAFSRYQALKNGDLEGSADE